MGSFAESFQYPFKTLTGHLFLIGKIKTDP